TNMSESGMELEFARLPLLRERVKFTFQAMGSMPVAPDGGVLAESFEAAGEVVWTREFERLAGVQFVDLTETSREQIRQWLSVETSANALPYKEKVSEEDGTEVTPSSTETLLTPARETPGGEEAKESLAKLATLESAAKPAEERQAPAKEEIREQAALDQQGEAVGTEWIPEAHSRSHPPLVRLTFLVVSGCLVAFAVTAGVRIFMSRAEHHAASVEIAPAQPTETAKPAGAVKPSLPTSSAESSPRPPDVSVSSISPASVVASSPEAAATFQVEVQDSTGRRWTLWFLRNGSKSGNGQGASHLADSGSFPALAARATKHKELGAAEKPLARRTFTLVSPTLNRGLGNPSAEAPAIQPELTAPSRAIEGMPTNHAVPPPVERPAGGLVEMARLIRSSAPVYPPLAKSTRVSGDVLVDALIDAAGNVTSVRVISGPVLLQQAAIETVRQWKYEPARLDGQAVAMHLNVTVRFRLN
ncbi:MAG TPA: TonB family protein, partial [Candidatus Dormibacteraeota bacterium]|nr:TonB family protein [Candidatus Dormibacteraeota bacterium]